jgi:hypothetical protein
MIKPMKLTSRHPCPFDHPAAQNSARWEPFATVDSVDALMVPLQSFIEASGKSLSRVNDEDGHAAVLALFDKALAE